MKGANTHLEITAIHEAGHALAALKVGRFVSKVAISHQSPGRGVTFIHESGKNPYNLSTHPQYAWQHTLQTTINDAFLTIAGPCAEAKFLGTPIRSLGCQSDYAHCIEIFSRLKSFAQYAVRYADIQCPEPIQLMNNTRSRARRWVAAPNNWRAINCIARAVLQEGVIDAEGLHEAIGEAMLVGVSGQLGLRGS